MSPLPPHPVCVDDILIRGYPSGTYSLSAPHDKFHQPHTCLALLVHGGQLRLEDDQGGRQVLNGGEGLLMAPWHDHLLSFSGHVMIIEFPSYRLNACALIPLWHQWLSDERHYLLATMMSELMTGDTFLTPASQRFVANAMSTLVVLPEPDQRQELVDIKDKNTSLRMEVARVMRDRMQEVHLRADDVADSLGISRAKLYRILASYGGFKQCLDAQRLDNVARRLKNPNEDVLSIKAILFRTGFSSTEQFQRLFHRRFGVSARDFRRCDGCETLKFNGLSNLSSSMEPTAL